MPVVDHLLARYLLGPCSNAVTMNRIVLASDDTLCTYSSVRDFFDIKYLLKVSLHCKYLTTIFGAEESLGKSNQR